MTLKRRGFLKLGSGLAVSLPLAKCLPENSYNTTSRSSWLAGEEQWAPSICQLCPGGCGIRVRMIDGMAVKVEGNPLHPLNKGKVCPKGQAGLQLLYHPNRIKEPLKKVGERGKNNWQPISWDEALAMVSDKLLELRASGLSHTLAYVGGDQRNTCSELLKRFFKVYGSPNLFELDEWTVLKRAYLSTQGIYDLLASDLKNSRMVLSFGAGFLTNWPNVMENQRIYGERRAKRDLKIVQIEPRFSIEASRADQWIPINQGSEGLLALGLASVLIRERLYNQAYIERFTSGFDEYRDYILKNIQLDRISDLTGVPLRSIIEIAKEFYVRQPAVAVSDFKLAYSRNGFFSALAIHSLNALVGNIDSPGGLLRQRTAPLGELPPVTLDEAAKKAASHEKLGTAAESGQGSPGSASQYLVQNILNKTPYEINCLFLSPSGDRLLSLNNQQKTEILTSVPFIVSFSSFKTGLSSLADLILPDTTFYEKWQDHHSSPLSNIPIVGISRPIMSPLHQSRPFESTLLTLARNLGENFALNFPWSDYSELLLSRMEGLYRAEKGNIFSSSYEEAQLRILEERGWWIPQYDNLDAFIGDLLEKGGWQDPSYHFNERSYVYQTPSRKFVFVAPFEPDFGISSEGGEPEDYPLRLLFFEPPFISTDSGNNHMPWYQESLGFRLGSLWNTWAEMNPETAAELGIQDKDKVWVESSRGRIQAVAKLFSGIKPGLVGIPLSKTERPLIPEEGTAGFDPLLLLEEVYDKHTGIADRISTRVKIYKANRS